MNSLKNPRGRESVNIQKRNKTQRKMKSFYCLLVLLVLCLDLTFSQEKNTRNRHLTIRSVHKCDQDSIAQFDYWGPLTKKNCVQLRKREARQYNPSDVSHLKPIYIFK